MKLEEVAERRTMLLKVAAAVRAEAAGNVEYRQELEVEATDIETLANSLYQEGDPALVAYRKADEDAPMALALGTLRTLAAALAILTVSPMAGVAAAFASAAAGAPVSRDQARMDMAAMKDRLGAKLAMSRVAKFCDRT
jgi:hypothetical protein